MEKIIENTAGVNKLIDRIIIQQLLDILTIIFNIVLPVGSCRPGLVVHKERRLHLPDQVKNI